MNAAGMQWTHGSKDEDGEHAVEEDEDESHEHHGPFVQVCHLRARHETT